MQLLSIVIPPAFSFNSPEDHSMRFPVMVVPAGIGNGPEYAGRLLHERP